MTQDRADNGMFWSSISLFCSGLYASLAWVGSVLHGAAAFLAAIGAFLGGSAAFGQLMLKLHHNGWFDHIRATFGRWTGRKPRRLGHPGGRAAKTASRR